MDVERIDLDDATPEPTPVPVAPAAAESAESADDRTTDDGFIEIEVAPDAADPPSDEPDAPARADAADRLTELQRELDVTRQRDAERAQWEHEQREIAAFSSIDQAVAHNINDIHERARSARMNGLDEYQAQQYIQQETMRQYEWARDSRDALHDQRTAQVWNAYAAAKAPEWATRVAEKHQLPAEAAGYLKQFNPAQYNIDEIAATLKPLFAERAAAQRQADQRNRSDVARRIAGTAGVAPGTGGGDTRRVKAGSDAHLEALLDRGGVSWR